MPDGRQLQPAHLRDGPCCDVRRRHDRHLRCADPAWPSFERLLGKRGEAAGRCRGIADLPGARPDAVVGEQLVRGQCGNREEAESDLIHLDHLLRTYGPEANEARANLRAYTTMKNDELFPVSNVPAPTDRETSDRLDRLLDSVLSLAPPDRRHTVLVEQALTITSSIYAERWLLWKIRHHGSPAIPPPADLLALPHLRQLRHFRTGQSHGGRQLFPLLARGRRRHPHNSRPGRSDASRLGPGLRRADAPRDDRDRPSVNAAAHGLLEAGRSGTPCRQ